MALSISLYVYRSMLFSSHRKRVTQNHVRLCVKRSVTEDVPGDSGAHLPEPYDTLRYTRNLVPPTRNPKP